MSIASEVGAAHFDRPLETMLRYQRRDSPPALTSPAGEGTLRSWSCTRSRWHDMGRAANNGSPEKAPVYELLAHDIKALDVEAVFGLMSADTALLATALDTIGV